MKVVLSTYLTRKGEPQGKGTYKPNDHSLIKNWYEGIEQGVIFHDQLTDDFIIQYPKVKFIKVEDYPYSANDGRFVIFHKYLLDLPEIEDVFMTDLFDVKVNKIPDVDPEYFLYVMTEPRVNPELHIKNFWRTDWRWVRNAFNRCNNGCVDYGLIGKTIYNPGVWGGKRENVIKTLELIIDRFKKKDVGEKNCNMLVFNQVMYHDIGCEKIFTGYPLHSAFKAYESDSKACFIHK